MYIQNFNLISEKAVEENPENYFIVKDNNSCKSRSSVTNLELNLYYVITNSYTKLQVNILKDNSEKSGKMNSKCDRQTDRQIDRQTDRQTD